MGPKIEGELERQLFNGAIDQGLKKARELVVQDKEKEAITALESVVRMMNALTGHGNVEPDPYE